MSKVKYLALAGLLSAAFAHAVAAQSDQATAPNSKTDDKSVGTIRGRVSMPDGTPLNNAVKIILRTPRSTETTLYTDFKGEFEFKDIPTGNYQIDAEGDWERFDVVTQSVQVLKDLTVVVSITLKEKARRDAQPPGASRIVSVGELDPKVPKEARREFERGSKAAAEHKVDEAIAHLRRAVELYPDFMAARSDLGAQLLEAGRLDEAAVEVRAAAALDPKAFNPRLNLGIILLKRRQYDEAARLLDQAISLDPRSPAAHFYAGTAQVMLKHLDRAEKELLLAHDAGGAEYALALFQLGRLYLGEGKRDLALQSFESYLREAPDGPNAEQVRKLVASLR